MLRLLSPSRVSSVPSVARPHCSDQAKPAAVGSVGNGDMALAPGGEKLDKRWGDLV